MVDTSVLDRLQALAESDHPTLTLYLDIDQNRQANRKGGYLVQADAMLKELRSEHPHAAPLEACSARALELVRECDAKGSSLLVVVNPGEGVEEVLQLEIDLPRSAHWRRGAFLRPLLEAMDEHERYAVVVTDKKRARIFTVFMGEVTERAEITSDTGSRAATSGTDQWWSQSRFQRHHDQEVAWHGKKVVEALQEVAIRSAFDRLIVAGPTEAAAAVTRLLPKRLFSKLVSTMNIPIGASPKVVLERILEVQERVEREREEKMVDALMSELHLSGKAVSGIHSVIANLNQNRLWKLLYTKDFNADGSQCRSCGAFTLGHGEQCSVCGDEAEEIPRFVDRISQAVLESAGRVEVVDGPAAAKLGPHGGIAALLRY